MQADSIKIESDEDGFHLIVVTDAAHHDFRIQSCAEALHEQVNLIIGGWLAEGERARREVDSDDREDFASSAERNAGVFFCNPDESGGYALSDPKSEGYHDRMSAIYDNREGK